METISVRLNRRSGIWTDPVEQNSQPDLKDRDILLGITGGIAAYKSAILTSMLVRAGARVEVVMTESATHLVGPRTFEALTGRPVRYSMWDRDSIHPHIELSRRAELLCIAPATANILAKAATGLADDLLSTIILAFDGPILLAPAMNTVMWEKPAVQRNCRTLDQDGFHFVGPEKGRLSCGESGAGRMAEPETVFDAINALLPVKSLQ